MVCDILHTENRALHGSAFHNRVSRHGQRSYHYQKEIHIPKRNIGMIYVCVHNFWKWNSQSHTSLRIFCNCRIHKISLKSFWENNLVSEMDLNSIRAFLTRIILLLQFLQFSTPLGRRRICCIFIKLSSKVCSNTKLQQAFISWTDLFLHVDKSVKIKICIV